MPSTAARPGPAAFTALAREADVLVRSALSPPARSTALRSHCRPKVSSRPPTKSRSTPMGMAVSAGPRAATTTTRTPRPAAVPAQAERQPRTVPIASTMVAASTASTAQAANTASSSPASVALTRGA